MKLADYSQGPAPGQTLAQFADQLWAALQAGQFDGVFHYMAGTAGWARRIEDPAVVQAIRGKGFPQLGIDIPFSPADVDGAATASRVRDVYGCPSGTLIGLDVEPERWVLDPAGWTSAADRWCDAIRAAGFSPGPYGNDDTVAACGNRAAWIWRAKPDQCDPAGPGLATTYFPGRRIVQCGAGVWGGIEFDINYSQFLVEVLPVGQLDDIETAVNQIRYAVAPTADAPVDGSTGSTGPGELAVRLRGMDDVLLPGLDAKLTTLLSATAALAAKLDAVLAGLSPAAASAIQAELAALGKHLGVDPVTGTDT